MFFTVSISPMTQQLFGRKLENFEVVSLSWLIIIFKKSFWHYGQTMRNINVSFFWWGLKCSFGMMVSFHKFFLVIVNKAVFCGGAVFDTYYINLIGYVGQILWAIQLHPVLVALHPLAPPLLISLETDRYIYIYVWSVDHFVYIANHRVPYFSEIMFRT